MTNYVLNDSKMFADITDGVAIVINSETGIYYGMNELGTAVFENLINGASTEGVLTALKALPGAPSGVDSNFKLFLDAIVEKELVILGAGKNVEVNLDGSLATGDNFIMSVTEYNDAQELLLADPIHEVKEETGWAPEKTALNEDAEDVARRDAKMEK